jgi:hypothetical protein
MPRRCDEPGKEGESTRRTRARDGSTLNAWVGRPGATVPCLKTCTLRTGPIGRSLGVDLDALAPTRPAARACLDWTERTHHLAGAVRAALFQAFQAKGWLRPGLRPRHMSTSRRRAGEPLPAASGGSDPETGEPVHGVHGARATDQPPGGEATRTDLAGSLTMSTTHITTRAAGSTGPRPALQRRSTGVPHQRLTGRHLPATLGRGGAAGAFRRARLR